MPRFYVDPSRIGNNEIILDGGEYNHIKNVLRKQVGDTLLICDGEGKEYDCSVSEFGNGEVCLRICEIREGNTELPITVTLFQGLPKKDKMELIIEKSVELGAASVIPVACSRSVAKLEDEKREEKKLIRWNSIAEAAAKQCGRGMIPEVKGLLSFSKAMKFAKDNYDYILFPYENADGMKYTEEVVRSIPEGARIAVFIGPEGGFAPEEVAFARECNAKIISLGRRILRTETAGLTVLSYLMLTAEIQFAEENV